MLTRASKSGPTGKLEAPRYGVPSVRAEKNAILSFRLQSRAAELNAAAARAMSHRVQR